MKNPFLVRELGKVRYKSLLTEARFASSSPEVSRDLVKFDAYSSSNVESAPLG
jgi:hypothetical protein